jgi:hypothetical protein
MNKKVNVNFRNADKSMWMMNYTRPNDCILWIHAGQNERQQSVKHCWWCIVFNLRDDRLHIVTNTVFATYICKWGSKWSLPYLENERQWCVNDSWSQILRNHVGDRLHIVINIVLFAFISERESDMLPASLWKWASTIVGLPFLFITMECGRYYL